ncbi:hypothetical protein CTAYLR_001593 [Chrysophaeum taylorii]|uniref:U1-type domain-containing protein n=1 Tax=Chrysophaeum taylorii TaxID=2483200 RepID=A0AAD7UE66_9STRA|nr:hypothetical protein CTAYLR_001593 [Chrysophaeum taylorii]
MAQVNNVERRRWNTAAYARKAQDREQFGDEYVDAATTKEPVRRDRQEFRAAEPDAEGPAGSSRSFLRSRHASLGLEANVGTARVLADPDLQKKATGWFCDVCDCVLRDSASYLDHVNGKKHLRKLGFSMRVARVGVDAVRDRFKEKTSRRKQVAAAHAPDPVTADDWEARLERAQRQEAEDRRAAKRRRQEPPPDEVAQDQKNHDDDDDDDDDEQAEMNALMGFGTFGGSKKAR